MGTVRHLLLGVLLFVIILLTGSYVFTLVEDHSLFESFFNVFFTITTVGTPVAIKTKPGIVLMMILLFFGMGTAIYIATLIAKTVVEGQARFVIGDIKGGIFRMRKERNHVVVCGYGKLGKAVCEVLKQSRRRFVIVETNEEKVKVLIEHGASVIQGDALEPAVLKKAGIERAETIIASLGNDANNIYLIMTASELNPRLLLAAEASEETAVKRLHTIGAQIVVLPQVVGGRQLAKAVLEVDKAKQLSTISKKSA